jgi:hypothetical protein
MFPAQFDSMWVLIYYMAEILGDLKSLLSRYKLCQGYIIGDSFGYRKTEHRWEKNQSTRGS